jgi:nucleotide-binding universal stress UspA family protein
MPRNLEIEATATLTSIETRGSILVATDGSRDSDGSVRVGLALARRDGRPVTLLSVVEPLPVYELDAIAAVDVDQLTTVTRESREVALHAQRLRTHPGIPDWACRIEVGSRVDTIATQAERYGASLIILGVGEHGVAARIFRRETALRVIRSATVPVLAVPMYGWGVPHSAVAAIDFTESSVDAAREALELLGGEGTLYLAHVSPRVPIAQGDSRTWEEVTSTGNLPRLEAVAQRLDVPPGVQVEYVTLHGEPAHELIAFAEEFKVDLIAAGAHGRTVLGRLLLGSVSSKLVRTAHCWVLVAPPRRDDVEEAAIDTA